MQIVPLSEGKFTVDRSKQFVPYDEDLHELQERPAGSLLVEVQPFVVVTDNDILLLDTGLGFTIKNGMLQLRQNLLDVGIEPDSITKVLISHLHKDHAGGLSEADKVLSRSFLSFPNATYFLQKKELDFAFEKGFPSFNKEELAALREASNVVLLTDDAGVIDNYIHYQITGAHSLNHQVFWIKENDETIFYGGDDAPQLQQMKHRFIAKYDFNGKKAMELRSEWKVRGVNEKWTFLFYHDVRNPVFTFSN